jgi:hypothetical protein
MSKSSCLRYFLILLTFILTVAVTSKGLAAGLVIGSGSSSTGVLYQDNVNGTSGGFGYSYGGNRAGVIGSSGSDMGVWGLSSSGSAVRGTALANGHGVYGESSTGFSGYFAGKVHVNGTLTKSSGSFVQPHRKDPEKEIVYAFFEGPEHAVFLRGTARLAGGAAVIETPEHFRTVAGEEGITVQFTPRSGKSKGLAAVEVTRERIRIEELMEGAGTYDFDYFITAKRAGFEKHEPIQPNTHFSADNSGQVEFEDRYSGTDDIAVAAIRGMLISNGILTPEGKLNLGTAARLGWSLKDPGPADTPGLLYGRNPGTEKGHQVEFDNRPD